jgi:hypothetical protein
MQVLRKASVRSITALAFAASALLTASAVQAAPGDYCLYANGYVYCGTEEFIYEGDPALGNCLMRWERGLWDCPPEE